VQNLIFYTPANANSYISCWQGLINIDSPALCHMYSYNWRY